MNSKSLVKIILTVVFMFISINISKASSVQEDEAKSWVNHTGRKLIDALSSSDIEEKYQTLDTMFNEDIDTDYMARFVIGKYWRTMNKSEQETYTDLFQRYARSIYKSQPLDFDTKGLDFEILHVTQNQKFTDVTCLVTLPEKFATETVKSVNVKFKLSQTNNKIKIVDLTLAEVSLLNTYRNRFYTMINQLDEEISWFLEDFNDMVISSEKTAEEKAQYY